jgi:DNA polymerase delta subunit 4
MPATRRARTSGGPATKGAQSTLSFGSRSRVTKAVPAASKLSKDKTESLKAEVVTIEPEGQKAELGYVSSEAAVQKQAEIELSKLKTEAEVLAEKVTDAQIKKYWKAREAERITPRGMVVACDLNCYRNNELT